MERKTVQRGNSSPSAPAHNLLRLAVAAVLVATLTLGGNTPPAEAAATEEASGQLELADLDYGVKDCNRRPKYLSCFLLDEPLPYLTPGANTNWQNEKFVCWGDGTSGARVHPIVGVVGGKSIPRGEIEKILHQTDGIFDLSASRQGSRRVVRWLGENCGSANARPKIAQINLASNWHQLDPEDQIWAVNDALTAAGYDTSPGQNTDRFIVFIDAAGRDYTYCGWAITPTSDILGYGSAYVLHGPDTCDTHRLTAHELAHTLGVSHLEGWPYINDMMTYPQCHSYEECAAQIGPACAHPFFQRLADCVGDKYFNPNEDIYFGSGTRERNIAAMPFFAEPSGSPIPTPWVKIEDVWVNPTPWRVEVLAEVEAMGADGQPAAATLTVTGPSNFKTEAGYLYAATTDPKPGEHTATITVKEGNRSVTRSWKFTLVKGGDEGDGSGGGRFIDVNSSNVFYGDIDALADSGITRGCNPPDNTRFCPNEPVTRGQMAAFLTRALSLPKGAATFNDTKGHTFENDVAALAQAGITRGCNPPRNDRFCPDEAVTRGQMAAFLVRALGLGRGNAMFTDTAGHVFAGDIAALADAGITRGCNPPTNDRFCPNEPVTRGQMAAFLVRAGLTD